MGTAKRVLGTGTVAGLFALAGLLGLVACGGSKFATVSKQSEAAKPRVVEKSVGADVGGKVPVAVPPAPEPAPAILGTPVPTDSPVLAVTPAAFATPYATTPPGPKPMPAPVLLKFTRLPDGAYNRNCVTLSVNGGPFVDFGCNKPSVDGGNSTNVSGSHDTVLNVLPKPYCNVVRIKLVTQAYNDPSRESIVTTENAAAVAQSKFWVFTTQGDYKYKVNINDNDDTEPTDANMVIDADGKLFFTIENSGLGCRP